MTSIPSTSNSNTSTGGINYFPLIQITNSHSSVVPKSLQQNDSNYDFTESGVFHTNTTSFLDSANFSLQHQQHQQSQLPGRSVNQADNDFFNKYYNHNHHTQYSSHNFEPATILNPPSYTSSFHSPKQSSTFINNFYSPHSNYPPASYSSQNSHSLYLNKTNDLSDILAHSTNTISNGLNRYDSNAYITHNDPLRYTSNVCNLDYANNLNSNSIKNENDIKKINKRTSLEYFGEKVTNENLNGNENIDSMYPHQDKLKTKLNSYKNASSSNNSMLIFIFENK